MLKNVKTALEAKISTLPVFGLEFKIKQFVDIVLEHFPELKIHNKTLWFYYNDYYHSLGDEDDAKSYFIRKAIQKAKGKRAIASEINYLYKELMTCHSEFIEFSKYETALNVNNCVVIFGKEGITTQEHSPEYFFTYKQSFAYNPKAECPLLEEILEDAFEEDATIDVLQEYFGYIFMKRDTLNLEKVACLVGAGANGKSLLLEVITYLVNIDNVSHVELKNFAKENNIIAMQNKFLNIGSDGTNKGVDTGALKKIASGERIEGKKLYNDVKTIDKLPKLLFALNQMPDSSSGDYSYGYLRRLLIFSFTKIIPEDKRDKHLLEKLQKELSGILNFAIEGYEVLLEQQDFSFSNAIEKSIKEYSLQLNHIEHFLNEQVIANSENGRTSHASLYKNYQMWCKQSGIRPITKVKLIANVRSLNKYDEYKNNTVKGFKFEMYRGEIPIRRVRINHQEMHDDFLEE